MNANEIFTVVGICFLVAVLAGILSAVDERRKRASWYMTDEQMDATHDAVDEILGMRVR